MFPQKGKSTDYKVEVCRWMLGVAVAPALLQIAGLAFLPESPRRDTSTVLFLGKEH